MPFEKDYNDQAKVVKYLLTANKELAKLQKEMTDGDKIQASLIREKQSEVTKLNKVLKDNAKAIKAAVSDYEDMDDTMVSIGNTLKQNNKFVNQQSIAFEGVKIATTSIAMQLADGAAANKKPKHKSKRHLMHIKICILLLQLPTKHSHWVKYPIKNVLSKLNSNPMHLKM